MIISVTTGIAFALVSIAIKCCGSRKKEGDGTQTLGMELKDRGMDRLKGRPAFGELPHLGQTGIPQDNSFTQGTDKLPVDWNAQKEIRAAIHKQSSCFRYK